MGDTKWTVDSMAVCQWHDTPVVATMARITHVMRSEAAEKSDGTTVHALPIDLDVTMDATSGLPGTDILQETILAQEVLLFLRFFSLLGHLLLAINETTKVRFVALVALVESASVKGILKRLVIVRVTLSLDSTIRQDTLFSGMLKSFLLDDVLHFYKWT